MDTEPLPFAKLMGLTVISVAPERVEAELAVRDDLCTRPAVLHGGAVMAFADTLGAIATVANLPQGAGTTTIESKTNFFAAIPAGDTARAETTPLHRGSDHDGVADPDHARRRPPGGDRDANAAGDTERMTEDGRRRRADDRGQGRSTEDGLRRPTCFAEIGWRN